MVPIDEPVACPTLTIYNSCNGIVQTPRKRGRSTDCGRWQLSRK